MKNMKLAFGSALLIAFLVLFAFTGTAAAKEWTVGASDADFQTIQAAVAAAADNDVIFIRSGTYSFTANLSISKSISLVGEDKESVILDLGGFSILPKKENIVIKSVTFINGSYGINLQVDAVNNVIENCIFDGMTHRDGIKLAKDGAVFKDNIVRNMSGFTNAVYITADNIEFTGNTLTGLSGSGSAARIVCLENAGNAIIEGNTITGNAGEAIRLWKAQTSDTVITNNKISGNTLKGIYLYNAGENNAIFMNDIFDNAGGNVASYGSAVPAVVLFNSPKSLTLTYNDVDWMGNPGNYWGSAYNGADTDGNGIGTTPKTILTVFADNAPLLHPFSSYAVSVEGSKPEQPEQPEPPEQPEQPEKPEKPDGPTTGGSVSMTVNILPTMSVSFSVDSLNFGDLSAGQTSEPKEMEIRNSGSCDVIVTAEVTSSSDDLYKRGLWIDDDFWPDYEKTVQKGRTASSDLYLKVPADYKSTGSINGVLILWVEAV
ncbi:MAG: right-handed parallel beta-helix repeat-containing protein [Methanimicrococcus sp.]|nr:right-handed parallel beta-helix repeat-containing protein [Methanimicrococcus sp.]